MCDNYVPWLSVFILQPDAVLLQVHDKVSSAHDRNAQGSVSAGMSLKLS